MIESFNSLASLSHQFDSLFICSRQVYAAFGFLVLGSAIEESLVLKENKRVSRKKIQNE